MTQPQRNGVLVLGIMASLLSMPMRWYAVNTNEGLYGLVDFISLQPALTGLNTSLNLFWVSTPIWAIVAMSICTAVVQLLSELPRVEVPLRLLLWLTRIPLIWMGMTALGLWWSGSVTICAGLFFGLAGALAPALVATELAVEQEVDPEVATVRDIFSRILSGRPTQQREDFDAR